MKGVVAEITSLLALFLAAGFAVSSFDFVSGNIASITGMATATDGLQGHWKFDEGFGTSVSDSGVNGNNGVLAGGSWSSDCKSGKCLKFNGTNYAEIPHSASLNNTDAITVEAWVKFGIQTGAFPRIIAKEGWSPSRSGHFLIYGGAGNPYIYYGFFENGNGHDQWYALNPVIDQWYHIAWTYNKSSIKLYVNGSNVKTSAESAAIQATIAPLTIGAGSGGYFNGTIDEVKIYSYALSAEEVKAEYDALSGIAATTSTTSTTTTTTTTTSFTGSTQSPQTTTTTTTSTTTTVPIKCEDAVAFPWLDFKYNNATGTYVANNAYYPGKDQFEMRFTLSKTNEPLPNYRLSSDIYINKVYSQTTIGYTNESGTAEFYYLPPEKGQYNIMFYTNRSGCLTTKEAEFEFKVETPANTTQADKKPLPPQLPSDDYVIYLLSGWNLVSPNMNVISSTCSAEDTASLTSAIVYDRIKKQFVEVKEDTNTVFAGYPDKELEYIKKSPIFYYFDDIDCKMSVEIGDAADVQKQMKTGWNFVQITPDITGKTVSQLVNPCGNSNVYTWDQYNQAWVKPQADTKLSQDAVGYSLAIKTKNDCSLPGQVT